MGRGIGGQQWAALGRIGDAAMRQHGHAVGDVRCPAPDRTGCGRASWSASLRGLARRGLIERVAGRRVRLTPAGVRAYQNWRFIEACATAAEAQLREQAKAAAEARAREAAEAKAARARELGPDLDAILESLERLKAAHAFAAAGGAPIRPVIDPVLAAAQVLGLRWPYTADDLKAAYRRLAKEHHPDAGGSAAAFRRVQEAYERLAATI
jgi:hypothetical protein